MHSFQNFIVRLIPNHPPPLETRIWKLVVRALVLQLVLTKCIQDISNEHKFTWVEANHGKACKHFRTLRSRENWVPLY